MRIRLNDDFLSMFPDASLHLLVCLNAPEFSAGNVKSWKDRARAVIETSGIALEHLSQAPEFQEWRAAYSRFGVKPGKCRSSVEQLWRRALQGSFVQTPVKLVDLYCCTSIIARVPMGGYDLDQIVGDLRIRLSEQGERFLAIGEEQPLSVPKGIVVYADDADVVCFAWNHRDGTRTCLRPETRRVAFFADSATLESRPRAVAGLDLIAEALQESGCEISRELLDRNHTSVEVTLQCSV
jgi:DNA/RNA-binding domain of Phe-tRNA-synthetase-like protein